jgi:hypothetical protein
MQFVYKPEGATPRTWEFDPNRLMNPEAEAIERHTGMTFGEWAEAVTKGSILAVHGLLYVLLKRSAPTLKWDEVQFCLAEVEFELADAEAAVAREALIAKAAEGKPLSEAEAAMLERLNESAELDEPAAADDPKED